MANMKHIGRMKETGRKVAVVFRTIPGDPHSALVVQTENIKDADHDKLMTLIESNTGQTADELADAMQRTCLAVRHTHTHTRIHRIHNKFRRA